MHLWLLLQPHALLLLLLQQLLLLLLLHIRRHCRRDLSPYLLAHVKHVKVCGVLAVTWQERSLLP
jgi:uncharacterized membrane protein affecting hemolysin expression